jgi:hypothetical protein
VVDKVPPPKCTWKFLGLLYPWENLRITRGLHVMTQIKNEIPSKDLFPGKKTYNAIITPQNIHPRK